MNSPSENMAVHNEIQVEAIDRRLVTGSTADAKGRVRFSSVSDVRDTRKSYHRRRIRSLTSTELDQKSRHGRRDVHRSIIKPVSDTATQQIRL